MTIHEFFDHFVEELKHAPAMAGYYRFLEGGSRRFYFRKNYFCRRLAYAAAHVGPAQHVVWDCGCGFGTTGLFLALNGYTVLGTTVESEYDDVIPERLAYWSRFGDVSGFQYAHKDLFDAAECDAQYDRIIVQDTLHHLEPIDEAVLRLRRALKPRGAIVAIEENGANIMQRLRLFMRRGTRRVVTVYDETLRKDILLGNENIRRLFEWRRIFEQQQLEVEEVEYIRLFLPYRWSEAAYPALQEREQQVWRSSPFLREYAYVGVNFVARERKGSVAAQS